jgi:flagellar protein FliO/FliZ
MTLDTLFGEGQTGLKVLFIFIVVLVVLALAFWLLRRFGGGRLGSAASRGRQPRLAVIDQAAVDSRRSLLLIRRDNVEHLLIIGGPTDVVVEQNIVRANTAAAVPARPATATDTLPRAVPLGDDSMWPLQPEGTPKEQTPKGDAPPRLEPTLRPEAPSLPPRPVGAEEATQWPGEEAEAPPAPPLPPSPRERKSRVADPLAELAEELSRTPLPPDTAAGEPRQPFFRRAPRQPPAPTAGSLPASAADSPTGPAPDQNLSDMAQRLEAALRRPGRTGDEARAAPAEPTFPGESPTVGIPDLPSTPGPRVEPALRRPFKADEARPGPTTPKAEPPPEGAVFTPPPRFGAPPRRPWRAEDSRIAPPASKFANEPPSPPEQEFAPGAASGRLGAPRRPFKLDDGRTPPPAPKAASETPAAESGELSPQSPATSPARAETPEDVAPARGTSDAADAKPGPPRSLYDSLEEEMASLLNRPPKP